MMIRFHVYTLKALTLVIALRGTSQTGANSSLTPTTGDCPVVPEESRPQAQRLGKDIRSGWKLILSFALHFLSLSLPST